MGKEKKYFISQLNDCKQFRELLNREYPLKGAPGFYVSRGMYEDLPRYPMKAWDWSEEQMNRLADRISDDFAVHMDYYRNNPGPDTEWLEDAFYGIAERTAEETGMVYYDDMTPEEVDSDRLHLVEFINTLKQQQHVTPSTGSQVSGSGTDSPVQTTPRNTRKQRRAERHGKPGPRHRRSRRHPVCPHVSVVLQVFLVPATRCRKPGSKRLKKTERSAPGNK